MTLESPRLVIEGAGAGAGRQESVEWTSRKPLRHCLNLQPGRT
jgi:hypothetical protein